LENSAINHSNLEKSIKILLNPSNYDHVPLPELLDKDIGKNLFTVVSLVEELQHTYDRCNIRQTLMNIKEYKGQLLHILTDLKTQVIGHFIEDKGYANTYFQILNQKREDRDHERSRLRDQFLQRLNEESEKLKNIKVEEEYIEVEEVDSTKDSKDSKERVKNKNKNNKTLSLPTLEEFKFYKSTDETKEEEKGRTKGPHYIHDELKLKSMKSSNNAQGKPSSKEATTPTQSIVTSLLTVSVSNNASKNKLMPNLNPVSLRSTSINDPPRLDDPKDDVNNPNLRKKICFKMAKILQDKYNLEVKTARDLTIKIETKIRTINPDMKQEYRDKILIILRSLKMALINPDEFLKEANLDFNLLKEKLEEASKVNKETSGDKDTLFPNGLQDSPLQLAETKSAEKCSSLALNSSKILADEL